MADDMRPEYDFSHGVRGKYAGKIKKPEPPPEPPSGDICTACGNDDASEMQVVNTSMSRDPLFSDLVCLRCGALIRPWNSV